MAITDSQASAWDIHPVDGGYLCHRCHTTWASLDEVPHWHRYQGRVDSDTGEAVPGGGECDDIIAESRLSVRL